MSTFIISRAALLGQLAVAGISEADLNGADLPTKASLINAAANAIAAATQNVGTPFQTLALEWSAFHAQKCNELTELQIAAMRGASADSVPIGGTPLPALG